ncbi:hypothetical protein CK203_014499 [Vitis vinifera]|uniref:Reverse transcriptase zinc-binding domain-containing protein n=1 Tax=Vitis vinifera TaxID=29760 RepID=A0A438K500_VITVI|nr:hypothetical protein CK203_014499 [Vitis vinifera]
MGGGSLRKGRSKRRLCRVFQGLLADPGDWKPSIDDLNFERLEEEDVEGLEKPFSEEEVFGALLGFCGEKAPGPDGFSMAFWQFSWDFVKEKDLKDFRPISLVGGLYKWLAKVLVNRMKGVLAKVISTSQNCFVEGGGLWMQCWLRANLTKSELIPVGRVENVEELADEFDYKVGKLPSTYIGMPLGAPFKCAVAWDGILPRVVRMRLEQIQRDFLWGGPWNQVIRRKYKEERGGWRSYEAREAYGVGLWKAISKMEHLVTPSFGFVVGDASSKEAWVNEVWTAEGERGGKLESLFNRPFNEWEVEEVERALQPVSLASFLSKIIWNSCVRPKLSFFVWEASWGRVLTLDRLQKRGWAWQIDVFCAKHVRSQLTTSSFIVKKQGSVDVAPFFFWSFLGFSSFGEGNLLGWRGSFVGKKRKWHGK